MDDLISHKGKSYYYIHPEICPHCSRNIVANFKWGGNSFNDESEENYITIWRCPNNFCFRLFVCEHRFTEEIYSKHPFGNYYDAPIVNIRKSSSEIVKWPQFITELNSGFLEGQKSKFTLTYQQSLEAEAYGLFEIAGMGFRKALEFLVKDIVALNLKSESREEELEKIKDLQLWPVIDKYFDEDLKGLLQRAAWLGNDQSHYFKIYEEFDIPELKEIIELIISDLDREIRKKRFLELESRKNKKDSAPKKQQTLGPSSSNT